MSVSLKKTAVIGLGGTGMNSVLFMKKKLMETYGEIPPMIKFLVIDTTDFDELESGEEKYILEPGEFLKIEVKDPMSLINTNNEVKSWLPERTPMFALTSGAKQIRGLGRLAVFANSSQIKSKIDGIISQIRSYRVGRINDNYEVVNDNIFVSLVGSLSGGTGSGCFLDVAVLVRECIGYGGVHKLNGYFLLPDVFVGKPATDNVEANAYGALKEISYFYEENYKQYKYKLGGSDKNCQTGIFNTIYLINNINKNGVEFSEIKDLHDFLGMGMYLQTTSTGKKASDVFDNLEGQLIQSKFFGKTPLFSSFGISELIYPGDWFVNLYTKGIMLDIVNNNFLSGNNTGINEYCDDFIRRAGLKEHDADDVINSIMVPGDYKKFPLPAKITKEVLMQAFNKRRSHVDEAQKDFISNAKKNLESFKFSKLQILDDDIKKTLEYVNGVELEKNFLNILIGKLDAYRAELEKESEQFRKNQLSLDAIYKGLQEESDKATKALLGGKEKIEIVAKKIKQTIDKETNYYFEIERRERAIEFFAFFKQEVEYRLKKLDSFTASCKLIQQELTKELYSLKNEKKQIKPFVKELKPVNLKEDIPAISQEDFMKWLITSGYSVLTLTNYKTEVIKNLLFKYALANEQVIEVKEKKIDDIVKSLPEDEKKKLINELDRMASPLWQYNEGYISGDKKTTNFYLFSVENTETSFLDPESVQKYITSQFPPAIHGTGDKRRVVCFKTEGSLPAFVINDMSRYKERYSRKDKAFSFHINKEWEQTIPDLFPETDLNEVRKYWSLGLADPFNLITKIGEFYYIKSERKGKKLEEYKIKLGQGRTLSMQTFIADPDLVDETRNSIEKITANLGNEKVKETLSKYEQDLISKAKKYGSDILNQIEIELNDIHKYVDSLGEL